MKRMIVGLVVGLLVAGACSSGPSKAEQATEAAKQEATRADCRKSFENFTRNYRKAWSMNDQEAVRGAIQTVYQVSVLSCATRRVWEEIGADVDPPLLKLTNAYARESVWKGMCDDFALPFTPPACTTYRK